MQRRGSLACCAEGFQYLGKKHKTLRKNCAMLNSLNCLTSRTEPATSGSAAKELDSELFDAAAASFFFTLQGATGMVLR